MSKDKNGLNKEEETNEPLLSIVTTNTIATPAPSAFATVLENKPTVPEEPKVSLTPKEKVVVETPKPVKKTVYELTYINDTLLEVTLYSYKAPTYANSTSLLLTDFFGKEELYENVLGLSEVKSSCKVEYDQEEVLVNLTKGVVIKSIDEEAWMSLDYVSTKKLFDDAVLRAYRQASAVKTGQVPVKTQQQRRTSSIPIQPAQDQMMDNEQFPVGNIPVNRQPLINDF